MNKIYKLVWNNVRGCYVVASEFAKAHGRSARRAVVGAFVAAAMVSGMGVAEATIPEGTVSGDHAIAIGEGSKSDEVRAIAIGASSESHGVEATALGYNTQIYGKNSVAVGSRIMVGGSRPSPADESIALGISLSVDSSKSVAIGLQSSVKGNSEGAIAIGLEAKVKENSEGSVAIGNNAIASHANSVALGAGSQTDRNNSIAVGNRQITGVAGGIEDTDAVNVKQMKDANAETLKKANDYTDTQIDATTKQLEHKINNTNDRVDRVGATAAALAAINYQPMAKGQSQVAVGMGGYKGKKATAIGMAYQFSDRVSGSVAGSASADEHMFNVGFNYVFGQHRNKDIVQCAVTPGSMSLKEAEMQSTIDSQGAKINDMEARIAQLEAMVKALAAK